MVYTVQPGDSIYFIAQRFNTTVSSIMALNNLSSQSLDVGQQITIPVYTEVVVKSDYTNVRRYASLNSPVMARMVNGARLTLTAEQGDWYRVRIYDDSEGWVPNYTVTRNVYGPDRLTTYVVGYYTLEEGPTLPSSFKSFSNNTAELSEVDLFMFRISPDDPTQIEKFGDFTDQDVDTLVSLGHRNNVKMLPVVHNLLYKPGGTKLAKDLIKQLVSTAENRSAFANNLLKLVQRYGFDGANTDIEDAYVEDKGGISALYQEIEDVLGRAGYFFSGSVPSRVSDQPFNPFSDPFDYAAIGAAVDQFNVMLYNEYGWPGSPPGPAVSAPWMERVLSYTVTKMPKEKVVAAVSVFGFDYDLTSNENTYVTYDMAMALANKYNANIVFDQKFQTPMFKYQDDSGHRHEVWFENDQSILSKIRQSDRIGIKGVALWRLGMEDPNIWTMLGRDVVVRKS